MRGSFLIFLAALVGYPTRAASSAASQTQTATNDAPRSSSPILLPSTPIIGESALVDKETGRIYWEGGSTTTLSNSLPPLLEEFGIRHLRATALSCLLLLAAVSNLVDWTRQQLQTVSADSFFVKSLLFALNWTILRIPKLDSRFVTTVALLYLLESNHCSTRRYLANAMNNQQELEDYIERLREESPVVTWKVRCYHYEVRRWLYWIVLGPLWKRLLSRRQQMNSGVEMLQRSRPSPSLLTKKVVTHQATGNYTFNSCQDRTVVGVWKRSEATRDSTAPFTKIVLSKLLVLSNAKAREDYFKQQSNFVTTQGQADEFAEFSTNIHVDGFKPRMLAVRPVKGQASARLFRLNMFWIFTFLGLTVPFRIWFARHCDELRVTVTKETSTSKSSKSSSWFSWSSKPEDSPMEGFRKVMRDLALYKNIEEPEIVASNETREIIEDIEVSAASAVEMNQPNETVTNATEETEMATNTTFVDPPSMDTTKVTEEQEDLSVDNNITSPKKDVSLLKETIDESK